MRNSVYHFGRRWQERNPQVRERSPENRPVSWPRQAPGGARRQAERLASIRRTIRIRGASQQPPAVQRGHNCHSDYDELIRR